MFYNEPEIEEIVARARHNPQLRPYADYLAQWVEIVNSNSDGWPYWTAGSRAAEKLTAFLKGAGRTYGMGRYNDNEMHSIRKMLSPIKSIATRKGIPAPVLHDPAEANSYGVRCSTCGEWETQCTC